MPPRLGSNDASIHEMSRVIGSLERAVDQLNQTVTTLTETWAKQDEMATNGRRELYGKVDSLREDVRNVSTDLKIMRKDVDNMNTEISSIRDTVDDFKETRAEARGAGKLMAFLSSKVTWVIGLIATVVGSLIVYKIKQGGADAP